MARIKRGVTTRAKHKRILENAKGYYGRRKNTIRIARQAVEKAGQYAYRDRKVKKRSFRALWIQRINAAVRAEGLTYGQFIHALKLAEHRPRPEGPGRHRDARGRSVQRDHRPGEGGAAKGRRRQGRLILGSNQERALRRNRGALFRVSRAIRRREGQEFLELVRRDHLAEQPRGLARYSGRRSRRPTSSSNSSSNSVAREAPAVVQRRFEPQPLPQLRAANLGGRGVFHQIVERHRALPAEPGGEILDADADILAGAGFGSRAWWSSSISSRPGMRSGIRSSWFGPVHRRERLQRHRDQRRDARPRCRHGRWPTSRNLSARTLSSAARFAASSPLTGMKADMPPMAKAPRRWQVAIRRSE